MKAMKTKAVRFIVYFCAAVTLGILIFMLAYILIKGIPYLNLSLFSLSYTSENCSVIPGSDETTGERRQDTDGAYR